MPNADLYTVSAKSTRPRVVLALAMAAALVFAWVAVRLQFGDMIAELTLPNDPSAPEMVDIARRLAPSDPLSVWLAAKLENNIFTPEKSDAAVRLFEQTVRLAPRDFRWWIELGRAYEQAERPALAEAALKQAVDLAPAYAFPRWQIGNFYLRQGRDQEAFAELKKATENNQVYREQVFSLAWEYFGKDPTKLEQVIAPDEPDVRASLAMFYAQHGRAEDSLRVWNLLSDEQKSEHIQIFGVLGQGLFEQHHFPESLDFTRQMGMDKDAKPETVTNGGFEKPIVSTADTRFGWVVNRGDSKLDITTDPLVHHEGGKSLRVVFRNYNKPDLYNIYQTIVIVPGKAYKLSFWIRTENLRSPGMPELQVLDANDNKFIKRSAPFPVGTNDWTQVFVEFTAPDNCNGIYIRTARDFCGGECTIMGALWYDEFELTRSN